MRLLRLSFFVLLLAAPGFGQFEFPVQLIGFPVIIIAVRIANFIKKLTYAFNPNTYRSRNKRGLPSSLNVMEVEKKLVSEMGEKVCIYEQVCVQYAMQAIHPEADLHVDWEEIFRKFASSPRDKGEHYLLSIFLGDIVGSPELCRQLSKRGRSCGNSAFYMSSRNPPPTTPIPFFQSTPPRTTTPAYARYAVGNSSPQPFFLPMEPQLGYTAT